MTVWRYKAVPLRSVGAAQAGELSGASEADVRAALRRIGLQVVRIRPMRRRAGRPETSRGLLPVDAWHRHLRGRRRFERTELYDSLATMLDAGLPLLEAVDVVAHGTRGLHSSMRAMLAEMREQLRSGTALSDAMSAHPAWFDATEVAMVSAGQRSGTLRDVLRTLARRHERSGDLAQKLTSALAYPALVSIVGLGVVIFLSVKTLPDLTRILDGAGVSIPRLTERVMAVGQFLAHRGPLLAGVGAGLLVLAVPVSAALGRLGVRRPPPEWSRRLVPRVVRRTVVARISCQLAELVRSGVPLVEAMRVVAPTVSGGTGSVRRALHGAADRIERGEDIASSLDDPLYFDGEFQRLVDVGQRTGELGDLLDRIGARYERQSNRLIDRLATLLEPCVILVLAVLIGLVVMAAILPILRLQEIL
jgi:type II secretory pathway component PulF